LFAATVTDYLGEMFERVVASLQMDEVESDAARVARMLVQELPKIINERNLYQRRRGFSWLRPPERRRKTFDKLVGAGFIRPAAAKWGRPRGDWDVNPRLKEYKP